MFAAWETYEKLNKLNIVTTEWKSIFISFERVLRNIQKILLLNRYMSKYWASAVQLLFVLVYKFFWFCMANNIDYCQFYHDSIVIIKSKQSVVACHKGLCRFYCFLIALSIRALNHVTYVCMCYYIIRMALVYIKHINLGFAVNWCQCQPWRKTFALLVVSNTVWWIR
jgi:hypothetical protein